MTVRDVAAVLQPAELLCRIADEVKVDLVELGEDGRLLRLQLEEVLDGVDPVRRLVVRDYLHRADDGAARAATGPDAPAGRRRGPRRRSDGHGGAPTASTNDESDARPAPRWPALSTDDLLDVRRVAAALGLARARRSRRARSSPAATASCTACPGSPRPLVDRIVEHFAGLQRIMRASVADLEEVDGVGEARARSVKDGLARLAEASILDRYT